MTTVAPPIIMNSADEGPSPFVQPNISKKKLTPALVIYLNDSEHKFYIHKKAKGSVLIDMVVAQMGLVERDYFGLVFCEDDEQKTQHWLYPDKRIDKQLKGLPWEFFFKVKFYPPQPTQFAEDFSRYLLYLQLRKDVFAERLPVGFAAQAHLGSLVAQAMLGDYQPIDDYANHLNNAKIAQLKTEQLPFIKHVQELHKNHRGLTQHEAELAYLEECKKNPMYGVHIFSAKDSKNKPVQIGVSSHGISVYNDQMRIHRFAWPGIVKISYRRSVFSIRLKSGELDQSKKETTVSYHLIDYQHAKLLWKCAVEHHGFFRLVQPEIKHKHSFLSFGSTRFRYTGRTNIQSQMASQLFEPAPIQVDRSKSKSAEMIAQKDHKEHSTPLNYADELSPQKQLNQVQPMATSTAKKEDRKHKPKDGNKQKKTKIGGTTSTSASSSSTSSSSSDAEVEEVHILVEDSHHQKQQYEQRRKPPKEQQQENAGSQPYTLVDDPSHAHTTVETWHEEQIGPEKVTTEVDEEGNMIKRTVRTEQIRHTVQTQSFQQVPVDDNENSTPINASIKKSPPAPPPRTSAVLYENGHYNYSNSNGGQQNNIVVDGGEGELVSTKVVTTGNRTVETFTYKTEKEGIMETRVEHRITIHSNEAIDHDAELSRAILEATNMNPELKVEKVEVDRGGLKK